MRTEAKVGLFVAVGLLFLFLLASQVNRLKGLGKNGYTLQAYIHDATGLEEHAKVKMKGVEIGYVRKIFLLNDDVVATLFIYDPIKVPADSGVVMAQESLLGSRFINILPGTSRRKLKESGVLRKEQPTATLEEMGTRVAEAADELKLFIHELRGAFNQESRTNLQETLSNFNRFSRDLKEVLATNKSDLGEALGNLKNAVEEIRLAASNFGTMSNKFGDTADLVNERIPALAEKFEKLEDDLTLVINENRKPLNSAITSVDSFFTKGEATVEKLDDYLDSVTQSRLDLSLRYDYLANDGSGRGVLGIDYMPYYGRHYMLDVITRDDYSKLLDGDFPANQDHQKGKTLFSAQVGKRYDDFLFRGGLIESTGGFGVDYFANYDKVKLTFEAFDFGAVNDWRGNNMHLRASVGYQMFKHINLYAGADNFLNQDALNFFVGAGVTFEDDRIKYLLGSGAGAVSGQ